MVLGLELGLIGSEWGEGSLENRSGERVGAPGRVRMGEGGGDGEFSGDWRGECWGESWVYWSWVGEGWDWWSLFGDGGGCWSFCGGG